MAAAVCGALTLGCGQSGEDQAGGNGGKAPPTNPGQSASAGTPTTATGGPVGRAAPTGTAAPAGTTSSNPTTNFFTTLDRAAKRADGGAQR
jgi:hypothetical protein